MIDQKKILKLVLDQYKLPLDGFHGPAHWARVLLNGQAIIRATATQPAGWYLGPPRHGMTSVEMRLEVITLFALLHDACRYNDDRDPMHGMRAGAFAAKLFEWGQLGEINREQLSSLRVAIDLHNDGHVCRDMMVQACWDADRLDLDRVGIKPEAKYLGVRDRMLIDECRRRALANAHPRFMFEEWGLQLSQCERSGVQWR